MSTILHDYNNLAFRCFFIKDVGITTPQPDYQLWKYMVINSIYESMYRIEDVNEVILAVDDTKSWRSVYFPRYKENRKVQRKKRTDVNWNDLFSHLNNYSVELRNSLPIKVIRTQKAEADDVIAVLCMDVITQDRYIISNDEDFTQLCNIKGIKVYHPNKMEYLECEDTDMFIVEKCLLGQSKDNIFNVKTPSDWGQTPETEGKRKPGYGSKSLITTMEYGWEKWLEDNGLKNNFDRNKILMDFRKIPPSIRSNIRKRYETYTMPEADRIYAFFKRNKFRSFLENINKVEYKFMELY